MIYLGLGSNLPTVAYGDPAANIAVAIHQLAAAGITVSVHSSLYETAPVPISDQPWYVNAVIGVTTVLSPQAVLAACLSIEAAIGRVRSMPNAARVVDIDVLAWHDQIIAEPNLSVPHPRLADRAFVLLPLAEIAPDWRHPVTGEAISTLISRLPPEQGIRRLTR